MAISSMAFKYYCSLKHNDTEILHHAFPLYFLFYFAFSSKKKKFLLKKHLASSLERKIKWPALCHLVINMFVFTGNLFFFNLAFMNMYQVSVLQQRRELGVGGHTVIQGAYGPAGSQTPPFQRQSAEGRTLCQW